MIEYTPLLLAAFGGYLLGSIPFGLVLTRLAGLGDIRKIGSGNIGATNVLRTGNKPLALAVLLLDGGKGAIAVVLARMILSSDLPDIASLIPIVAGIAAVLGHNFPVWLGFKGGKGVATTLGTLIALSWPVGLLACLTWAVVAAVFRYSSLSALLALGAAPFFALLPHIGGPDFQLAIGAEILTIVVWLRHHANIRRLLSGTEPKIGKK